MLSDNSFVSRVRRVERGTAVELVGDRTVPLDPEDGRSAGFATVLEGLRELGAPAYLELHPETGALQRLFIPIVSPVVGVRPLDDGALGIELAVSQAVHRLPRSVDDFDALERQLRDAIESRVPVVIVEDDTTHEIIHVQDFEPDPEGPAPRPFPEPVPHLPPEPWARPWWLRLWWWRWWPWWWLLWWLRRFGCVSTTKAQQVFDAMNAKTCDPVAVPPPCIPFMYPDNGCWARAHEMCRLMLAMNLKPKKVWIRQGPSGGLHVNTRNNPQCSVSWWYHVAPILCVRSGWFTTESMVIDPSMFTTPVTQAAWKAACNDPTATLTETDQSQYWPSGGTDPTYTSTNIDLATYRLALQNRSNQVGPPPYANCP